MSEHPLLKHGFLATSAPLYVDVVLVLEIAMALVLLLGAFLARAKKHRSHARCQSAVVLLNLVVIFSVMVPAFHPGVMLKLSDSTVVSFYIVSSVHAILGITAEAAALYILLAAGTKALPERLRFKNYRLWMRCTLLLWWSTLLLGVATYVRWYVH